MSFTEDFVEPFHRRGPCIRMSRTLAALFARWLWPRLGEWRPKCGRRRHTTSSDAVLLLIDSMPLFFFTRVFYNVMNVRVAEDDLIDMATNVCDADMDEGDWIPMLVGQKMFLHRLELPKKAALTLPTSQ